MTRSPLLAAAIVGGGVIVIAGIAYAFIAPAKAQGITWTPIPPHTPLHPNLVYRFSDSAVPTDQYTVAQMQALLGSDFRVGNVVRSPPPSDWIDDGGMRLYVEFDVARDGVTLPAGASSNARLYVSPPGFV